jgi:hypothetical protein
MPVRILKTMLCLLIVTQLTAQTTTTVDICVYGGTSAGVMAAYTAKKMGRTVLLVEPGKQVGGLTTGGLGYTDIGNKYAVTGLSLDFYRRLGKYYGKFESWIFEPHVAENTFREYMQEAKLDVLYSMAVFGVKKEQGVIKEIEIRNPETGDIKTSKKIKAGMFIDCSYEGDLMAKAGVSYTVGRESNSTYNEQYNGVQLKNKHQFPDGVDPYIVPGKPESGLLWGISPDSLQPQGQGDKKVQAYNFRICLTDRAENRIPITRPEHYDSTIYTLLLRVLEKAPAKDLWAFLKFDIMPNRKTDINNNGAFSTDMIGMNYNYPDADYPIRKKITDAHADYAKGLLYFIGHDPRMPEHLRKEMLKWGYPKDEYPDNGNWSPQMYVREARRMVGAYVMTQANCEGKELVKDGVGMAAYTMDSHNCQRLVVNGMVKNEGDVQSGGFGPYPIAYRSIIPKASECGNLLVPVCLSASHIAYGSIRMEPVFMVLAQSAATAAVIALKDRVPVQQVNVQKVQALLAADPLVNGATPEIMVDNADKEKIEVKGSWTKEPRIGFGPDALTSNDNAGEEKWVKFKPGISKAGYYKVYTYFLPGYKNTAPEITVRVGDGKSEQVVVLKKADINVQGQTSGEWILLGRFNLDKGSYAVITSQQAAGAVVADAMLFAPDRETSPLK